LNAKLESLKSGNVENGWNNFRKLVCEVSDRVFGKRVKNVARNDSENAL